MAYVERCTPSGFIGKNQNLSVRSVRIEIDLGSRTGIIEDNMKGADTDYS